MIEGLQVTVIDRLLGNDTRFDSGYSVYVGENTSLAHGVLIHGPAFVGNNTFIGMESLVFDAKLGNNVAVGVASTITGGVEVADDKFVPPGSVITTQEQADALPERVGSAYENINSGVVPTNEDRSCCRIWKNWSRNAISFRKRTSYGRRNVRNKYFSLILQQFIKLKINK